MFTESELAYISRNRHELSLDEDACIKTLMSELWSIYSFNTITKIHAKWKDQTITNITIEGELQQGNNTVAEKKIKVSSTPEESFYEAWDNLKEVLVAAYKFTNEQIDLWNDEYDFRIVSLNMRNKFGEAGIKNFSVSGMIASDVNSNPDNEEWTTAVVINGPSIEMDAHWNKYVVSVKIQLLYYLLSQVLQKSLPDPDKEEGTNTLFEKEELENANETA